MAKVTFSIAIDMQTFAGYDFSTIVGSGGHGHTSDTEYNWQYNTGFYEIVDGSGFSGGFGTFFPDAGTVTGWNFGINQLLPNPVDPWHPITGYYSYWNFTELSVPAADFSNAVDGTGADVAAYMPTMLAGNDTINGSAYDDYLLGFDGNDVLNGGLGADSMAGGLGNDTYFVERSTDKAIEDASAGTDRVLSSASFTLGANVENLTLTGSAAINGTGNTMNNIMVGNAAANSLRGAAGNDVVKGLDGNDTLAGNAGNDTLYGGNGADEFVFNTPLSATTNFDKIVDFVVADDTVVLDQSVFTQLTTLGTLGAAAFYNGTSAHDSDDRIIYDSATGNIYYDPDGNASHAQILFAHVTAATALTNADFLVVA